MNPKEKAKQLIDSFKPLLQRWDCYNDEPVDDEFIIYDAKKCALIAIDEIIDALENHAYFEEEQYNFFVKVKKEIEDVPCNFELRLKHGD
jgi:hypothetical protein